MTERRSYHTDGHTTLLRKEEQGNESFAKNSRRDGILTIIGGMCIHLVLGNIYLWGAISLYVASYLRFYDSSIDKALLTGIFPFIGLGQNIGMIYSVQLAEKVGYRPVLVTVMTLLALITFLTSYITIFPLFVIVYGVMFGLCIGTVYMLPVVCGWKYFPNRKGLVSGVTVGAYAFASFIFNFVAMAVVNPDNLPAADKGYFSSEVYDRVPLMFRVLSLCFLVLGVTGAFLIRVPKYEVTNEEATGQGVSHQDAVCCGSVRSGVRSKTFAYLFFMSYFASFFGLFMSNNYKIYELSVIDNDQFVTIVGSLGSISNGLTRPLWATFFDKFGFRKVFLVLVILQAGLAATLSFVSGTKALFLIWYCLIMSCEGGSFAIFPATSAKVFGIRYGAKIYSILFWSFSLASFTAFFLVKFAQPRIGWNLIFMIGLIYTIAALILNIFFKEEFVKKNKDIQVL